MNLHEFKKELLKDPNFHAVYYNPDIAFQISEMIVDLRIKLGLTQKELAKKTGTYQSSIARLENGNFLPSISFLEKIAKSVNSELIPPKFSILENSTETYNFVLTPPNDLLNLLNPTKELNYKTPSNF